MSVSDSLLNHLKHVAYNSIQEISGWKTKVNGEEKFSQGPHNSTLVSTKVY